MTQEEPTVDVMLRDLIERLDCLRHSIAADDTVPALCCDGAVLRQQMICAEVEASLFKLIGLRQVAKGGYLE